MKTKQQIQDEMAELQKLLEEMDQPKTYHYLMLDGAIACTPIKDIFNILPSFDDDGYDQSHGLGKFETRKQAEHCRAALVGILHLAKFAILSVEESNAWNIVMRRGREVIHQIEKGTYE